MHLLAADPWRERVPHLDMRWDLDTDTALDANHGVDEADTIPELEERGGHCDCEVIFNVSNAPREWLRSYI